MKTELYWVPGPWTGRLAIMPRPRGGDWLEDEVQGWVRSRVNVIVSLLTPDEVADLELGDEEKHCAAGGIEFISFPIDDREVPTSRQAFSELMAKLIQHLADGKNIAVHCRQGIGRAALVAICLLVSSMIDLESAIKSVSQARRCFVPETLEQRRWVADFTKRCVV